MTLKKNRIIVAGAITGLFLLGGCSANDGPSESGDERGPLVLGHRSDLAAWNPSQANVNDSQQVFQAAYDTLIRRTPDGEFVPMLATDWEYNEDQTQLTVKLRDDVTFSDGAVFDSASVLANYENLRDGNGPQANTVANLESVEAPDATTVVYTLAAPDPAFLLFLSGTAGFQASPVAIEAGGLDMVPVGSGPYVLDESRTTTGSSYTLTAREDYWAPELQQFSEVTFTVLTDSTARLNALVSGQVDAALVDVSMAGQAESSGLELTAYSVDWSGFMLMDREGELEPALADVRVRQAINMAFDREALVREIVGGYGAPTSQFFGPNTPGYLEELDTHYTYDPERARELMAEAGYADGFAVTLPSAPSLSQSYLDVLTQQLADIGIDVSWASAPSWGAFVGEVSSGNYPMPMMNQAQGDTWVEVRKMIAPDALYNPFGFSTDVSSDLIESLQHTPVDAPEFEQIAQELGTYITEEAWFAPVYRFDMMYFHSPEIDVLPQTQLSSPSIYNYSPIGEG